MSMPTTKVAGYTVRILRDRAALLVEGEDPVNAMHGTRLAIIDYVPGAAPKEVPNRGGFLSIVRSLELLAPTIDILRNEDPVFFHDDGTFSTSAEPAGEGEAEE